MKNNQKIIVKNSLWLVLREFFLKFINLFIAPIIVRSVETVVYGVFSWASRIFELITLIGDFGVNKALIKEIAQHRDQDRKYLANTLIIKIIIFVLISLIFMVYSIIYESQTYQKMLILMIFQGSFFYIMDTLMGCAQGCEKFSPLVKMTALVKILNLVTVIVAFLIIKLSFFKYLFVLGIINFFIFLIVLNKTAYRTIFYELPTFFDMAYIKSLLKLGLSFFAVSFFARTFGAVDSLMINSMLDAEKLAYYSVAYKLVTSLQFLPGVIGNAMFPTIARIYKEDLNEFFNVFENTVRYLAITSVLLSVPLYFCSEWLVILLFTEKYRLSIKLFELLLVSLVFTFVSFPFGVCLGTSGNQRYNIFAVVIASIVNIVLNYYLILLYGVIGVVYSTIFTSGLILVISILGYLISFKRYGILKLFAQIILIGIISFLAGNIIRGNQIYLTLARSAVFSISYLIMAYLTGLLRKTDITRLISK